MNQIKNKQQLIENGETPALRKARAIALDALEYALDAVDPKNLLRAKLQLDGSVLRVEGLAFDLGKFRHVYVVGGGKAGGAMAEALEDMLGERLTAGAVNVPYGDKHKTRIIRLHEAGHPVPDEAGAEGTRRIVALAEKASEDDLVICLISGGGSSLMPLPREGVTLEDKKTLTKALLKSGAAIEEINIVRKHLSAFKGGWLAKAAFPATVLNLVLSDVVGDALDTIASGPTVSDSSTFFDARGVLEKYGLWTETSASVQKILLDGEKGLIPETPKSGDPAFKKVHNVIVGNNHTAGIAVVQYLKSHGLNVLMMVPDLKGEAREAGKLLATTAREISGATGQRGVGAVAVGETTVTVKGSGLGGRNQEEALSAALNLEHLKCCAIACLSTDGVDGPTDAAGAIIDENTLKRATQAGLETEKFLAANDSYHFFSRLGDLIVTGQTGTNVNDISLIILL